MTLASGRRRRMAAGYEPSRIVAGVAITAICPLTEARQAASAPGSITPITGMCGYAARRAGKAALVAVLQAITRALTRCSTRNAETRAA